MDMKEIVVCEDSFDGVLCGVYHAWIIKNRQQKTGKYNLEMIAGEVFNYEIFAEYTTVDTDLEVSAKVRKSIQKTFSRNTYVNVYYAAMSGNERKADIVLRFLVDAYRIGRRIEEYMSLSSVMDLMELSRNVSKEREHFLSFVRFQKIDSEVLISRINPKNNILTLIAPHFSDRLSMENWIIYDEKRKIAALHPANGNWMLVSGSEIEEEVFHKAGSKENEIEDLWRVFFETIAIKERTNPNLQRNHLPLRFRKHMTEFQAAGDDEGRYKSK